MRDMKQRHSKTAGEEIARNESAAQKCRSGNCEKWKLRYNVTGVENAAQAAMHSQKNIYYELIFLFADKLFQIHFMQTLQNANVMSKLVELRLTVRAQ